MNTTVSNPAKSNVEVLRKQSHGCWTGWVADMEVIKNITTKSMPDNYMESYPRNRATTLNTWLKRFGLYSNGMFFELDRAGSAKVKDLIKHSSTARGFLVRIDGSRDGHILKVKSIVELPKPQTDIDFDNSRYSQSQLRGEFAKMGI
jgi:hypothetical protein